jgi:hypothetical protein
MESKEEERKEEGGPNVLAPRSIRIDPSYLAFIINKSIVVPIRALFSPSTYK